MRLAEPLVPGAAELYATLVPFGPSLSKDADILRKDADTSALLGPIELKAKTKKMSRNPSRHQMASRLS